MFDITGSDNIKRVEEFSPLVLAYIGDSVYDILTRQYIISQGNATVNVLDRRARKIVNAAAQSAAYEKIKDSLTDAETAVYKRGRNAKSHTSAKNQSITDYRRATGVEALFGYLYLKGENDRIRELYELCISDEVLK